MFRQKLFKRIMPMLLSISMMFQTVSGTALAAEVGTDVLIEESAVEDTAAEETAEEEAAPEETVAEDNAEEETVNEDVSGSSAQDEAVADGNQGEEAASDETGEVLADENAELPTPVINLNKDYLASMLSNKYYPDYTYDMVSQAVTVDYHTTKGNDFTADMQNILNSVLYVTNGSRDGLKYSWQKKSGESYADMTGDNATPSGVGSYRLKISLDAVEGVSKAAEPVSVDFEIKKTALRAGVAITYFQSGKTAADVKKENGIVTLYKDGEWLDNSSYDADDKVVYNGKYIKSASVKVKDVDNDKDLADTDLLKQGVNYVIVAEVTLKDEVKDNYEVTQNATRIEVGDAIYTEIKIEYTDEDLKKAQENGEYVVIVAKTYDKEAVDAKTQVESKYTAKVMIGYGEEAKELKDENGKTAEIKASWCDSNYNEYTEEGFAPTDAGTYYYKLSYTDEEKAYDSSEYYIPVKIEPAALVIVPKLDSAEFYKGISVAEVLKGVGYDAYTVVDGKRSDTAETIDEYYWGVYNSKSYEPVFAVQVGTKSGEGDEASWSWDTTYSSSLEPSSDELSYRIVPSEYKATYDEDGDASSTVNINSGMKNYEVDLSDESLSKYAAAIKVNAGTEAEIKVDLLLKDGAGAELGKPIIKTYDGKGLYSTKSEYKKATVTLKESTTAVEGGELTYTWQYAYGHISKDEEGNASGSFYDYYSFEEVEVAVAPSNAGVYRLKIEYVDESHQYSAKPAYVYYSIKPQDIVLSLEGAPAVFTDLNSIADLDTMEDTSSITFVSDFIEGIQNNIEEMKSSYISVAAYPATVAEDADGKATAAKVDGAAAIASEDINLYYIFWDWYKDECFFVQKKTADGWIKCESNEPFVKGTEYRLCVNWENFNDYNSDRGYNGGSKLDDYGQVIQSNYYDNESINITVKTGGKNLTVTTTIASQEKTYDGKPFYTEDEVKSSIKVMDGTTDVTSQVNIICRFEGENNFVPVENAIHADTYTLVVYIDDTETYKGGYWTWEKDVKLVIEKKPIKITPTLKSEISAGIYMPYADVEKDIIDSYTISEEADKDVISDIDWYVCKRNSKNSYNGYLKSSEEYYLTADVYFDGYDDEEDGWFNYGDDYTYTVETAVFKPVRAAAEVKALNTGLQDDAKLGEDGKVVHTVTTKEAVPFSRYNYFGGEYKDGNIFTVRLYAPDELSCDRGEMDLNAICNSFNAKGVGYCSNTDYEYHHMDYNDYSYYYRPYIEVALDATNNDTKDFTILWNAAYAEKYVFDFGGSELEADFTKAVEPKSIAFNGAVTKMVVGDVQQLDVKLSKLQMNDIIYLGYKSDNESVLYVYEDTGMVVALSNGTASVEVYPCVAMMDKNGNLVKTRIGTKSAKVKITVSEVAAPKISGLTQIGNDQISVKYKIPANGGRREIYVLKGKKTINDFEGEIGNVKNGDYSKFVHMSYAGEYYANDKDKKSGIVTVKRNVGELSQSEDYTVYVRNVSKLRTVGYDNEFKVALSHAGAVKTFKATKPQAIGISAYFDLNAKGQTVKRDEYDDYYYAELKDKSAKLSVNAFFNAKHSVSDTDKNDYIERTLPLQGNDKTTFEAPKLDYFVYNYELDDWAKSNDIASIDKSGKITFKGRGWVNICVVDTKSERYDDELWLDIKASPNSLTGKKGKVIPGDVVYLSDYLEYKQDKVKIAGYQDRYADLKTDAVSNDSFLIEKVYNDEGPDDYVCNDYQITVLKPNETLNIQVTDREVTANGGKAATVELKSAAVEPVKNLKADVIHDKQFRVSFTYPIDSCDFKYELKDSRGSVVCSKIEESETIDIADYGKYYDSKKKCFVFTKLFTSNDGRIEMLSNYDLTVTALCNGTPSKDAKLKVKTTNIPASYYDVNDCVCDSDGDIIYTGEFYPKNAYINSYGDIARIGSEIKVRNGRNASATSGSILSDVISGNTYTLELPLANDNYNNYNNYNARLRKTDTLTWSIKADKEKGDTGAATLKANTGSYTATLKALKPGWTNIEVSSKLTKKVIARYRIYVYAVGEARYSYYGDNEPH